MNKVIPFFNSSDIKLIVFDLHGTITNRTSVHPYHIEYRNKYIERILGKTVPDNLHLTTDEAFAYFPMLDKRAFYQYRNNDPQFKFENIHVPNPELNLILKSLSNSFHFVLYTDSYKQQIDKTLTAIDLGNIFDVIIGVEDNQRKLAKETHIFPMLCNRFKIEMNNILMLGDKMDKDIDPILKAGGNALKIKSSEFIMEALDLISRTFVQTHSSKRVLTNNL